MLKVYVVNLKVVKERREHMEQQLSRSGLAYEFIEAIDSSCLSQQDIIETNRIRTYFQDLRASEIACALSHIKAIKKIVEDKTDLALVLEDDVIISRRLDEILNKLNVVIQEGEVVSLCNLVFEPIQLTTTTKIDEKFTLYTPQSYEALFGTQAYAMSYKTAAKLQNFLLPVTTIADDWNKMINDKAILRLYLMMPYPVQHAEFQSIVSSKVIENKSLRTKIKEFIYFNKVFPVYQLLLFYRRLTVIRRHKANIFIDGKNARTIHDLK